MRVLLQRAASAQVRVHGSVIGAFDGPGLVLLVGVTHTDTDAIARKMAQKSYGLRVFDHRHAPADMCLAPGTPREVSAQDLHLPCLVVSQFTLYANTAKGKRPTWDAAAPGAFAEPLIDTFIAELTSLGSPVHTGQFGADMQVSLTNDGPITVLLEQD
jgi:D-aminoacyl-tRNA deacylase